MSEAPAFDLSGCPDFPSLDAAAPGTAERRTYMLALIGNLSFAWSNNESLFIHLVRVLMQTDEASAVIVFVTLSTARSRIELVERLGRAKLRDQDLRRDLEGLIARFNQVTRVRNEFNHCMYGVDDTGVLTHTQSFRIRDVDGVQSLERPRPIDDARVASLVEAGAELKALNRAFWSILPRLEADVGRRATAP